MATTSQVLFHFTNSNSTAAAADFRATILWGDGSASVVTSVADSDGCQIVETVAGNESHGFDVIGSHTYGETFKNGAFVVGVCDTSGDFVCPSGQSMDVSDAPLSAASGTLTPPAGAVPGVLFPTQVLFHFSHADTSPNVTAYTATIYWADGSSTSGVNSVANGNGCQIVQTDPSDPSQGFDVVGSHAYTTDPNGGTFEVVVTETGGANVEQSETMNFGWLTATTTTVTASSSTALYGQPVTLTAAVSGSESAETGENVEFYDGQTDLGGAPLVRAPHRLRSRLSRPD